VNIAGRRNVQGVQEAAVYVKHGRQEEYIRSAAAIYVSMAGGRVDARSAEAESSLCERHSRQVLQVKEAAVYM
jgi:hypothetical protein